MARRPCLWCFVGLRGVAVMVWLVLGCGGDVWYVYATLMRRKFRSRSSPATRASRDGWPKLQRGAVRALWYIFKHLSPHDNSTHYFFLTFTPLGDGILQLIRLT